jgi:hypothetical protein
MLLERYNGEAEVAKQSIVASCLADRGHLLASIKISFAASVFNSFSFDSVFWINLPLRRSFLPDEDN